MDRSKVPPGWLPDPDGLPTLRWWDGEQWTDQLAPIPGTGAPTAPTGAQRPSDPEVVLCVAEKHWASAWVLSGIALALVGMLVAVGSGPQGVPLLFVGVVLIVIGALEQGDSLEVTTTRVRGHQQGLVSKRRFDTRNSQVEGMVIDTGLLGRVFGYRTVVVRGTGGSLLRVACVRNAEQLAAAYRAHEGA